FFFSSRRRHTRCLSDWSSDVCSSDLFDEAEPLARRGGELVGDDPPAGDQLWCQVQARVLAHRGEHAEAERFAREAVAGHEQTDKDRKSTRLNSSHLGISYAVFCLKKKNITNISRATLFM